MINSLLEDLERYYCISNRIFIPSSSKNLDQVSDLMLPFSLISTSSSVPGKSNSHRLPSSTKDKIIRNRGKTVD